MLRSDFKICWMGRLVIAINLVAGMVTASQDSGRVDFSSLAPEDVVADELLVKFAPGVTPSECDEVNTMSGAELEHAYSMIPWQLVKVKPSESLQVAADVYSSDSRVLHVEPNYIVHALELRPNDPRFGELWGMERISAPAAWDSYSTGSSNIVVGVIDTGILRTHEDLAANIWTNPGEIPDNGIDDDHNGYIDDVHGWDFVNNDNDPTDDAGHGTHVSGTIGGVGNNGIGVAGVNWTVRLVGLKFLGADGSGTTADALKALEYAIRMSKYIKFTSNSWGGGGASLAMEEEIGEAAASNQLFIAAAGNDATDNDSVPQYPSSYTNGNIIAVASIQQDGNLSGFSCYGANSVDIAAPGSHILSTVSTTTNSYAFYDGTSMATPHVSGVAAMLWGMQPDLSWQKVRDAIYNGGVDNVNLQGKMTTGRELNLLGALRQIGAHLDVDRLAYRSDALVRINLTEPGATGTVASVDVNWMTKDDTGLMRDSGVVALTPTAADQTVFEGSLQLETGTIAEHGDLLTLSYTGLNDRVTEVAVPIDDIAPVISNVEYSGLSDESVKITWDTDESADGYAWAGMILPPAADKWDGDSTLVGWGENLTNYSHDVLVSDLSSQQQYYFAVRSMDAAGNVATYPVDVSSIVATNYPRFITLETVNGFMDDMEAGEGRWEHAGLKDIWQHGNPSSGPQVANSGTNCWATNLNGPYESLMNAWLISKPIWVGAGARIKFSEWHSIEEGVDAGFVEVNSGQGWINVLNSGDGVGVVDGTSDGWEDHTIRLPEEFENKMIQTRFRLITDSTEEEAGWYIDDFEVDYAREPGLGIRSMTLPVDDSPALSPGNDGDGYPEPGETVNVGFEMVNTLSTQDFSGVIASVDSPAEGVTIVSGHNQLNFGTVKSAEVVNSTNTIKMILSDDVSLFEKPVTFFFHVEGGNGYSSDRTYSIKFEKRDSIGGVVRDTFGNGLEGATVLLDGANGEISRATTSVNGEYILPGIISGQTNNIHAMYSGVYSPSDVVKVSAPTSGVDFVLGKAYASINPKSFNLTVKQYDQVELQFEVANTNAAATTPLKLDISSDFDGTEVGLSYSPTNLIVSPGGVETATVDVAVNDDSLGATNGNIRLSGNAMEGAVLDIPVELYVVSGPVLSLLNTTADDADGDGFIDSGETCGIDIELANIGAGIASGVTGLVSFAGASGAVMNASAVTFGNMGVNSKANSYSEAKFTVDSGAADGLELPFVLDLWDADGVHWSFDFNFTVETRRSIWGSVADMDTPQPLGGVSVRAYGSDGTFSGQTDSSGDYNIYGLGMGVYTVRVDGVSGYGAPPAQEADTTLSDVNLNFIMYKLDIGVSPNELNFEIDEGRSTNGTIQIANNSIVDVDIHASAAMVEGTLEAPQSQDRPKVDWSSLSAEDAVDSEMVVRFREGTDIGQMMRVCGANGGSIVKRLKLIPACLVRVNNGGDRVQVAADLASSRNVEYVEPNYRYKFYNMGGAKRIEPNDAYYGYGMQWGLDNYGQDDGTVDADIDAPEAWAMTRGNTNVIVAILDTGCDLEHPDLMNNLWINKGEIPGNGIDDDGNGYVDDVHGYNFVYDPSDPNGTWTNGLPVDDVGHGTHVAGTIGAVSDNQIGVAGVAWNVRLMILKIGDSEGLSIYAATEALEYAIMNGARISNNSWGGSQYSKIFHDEITAAAASNLLVVCAAGNDGSDNDLTPKYPASDSSENVIAVAATDSDDLLADFSDYGLSSVDIAAPGVGILSTYPGGYTWLDGTSMASPHVAGVAALLAGYAPKASWQMLKEALMLGSVSDDRLKNKISSGGHLNAYRSLQTIGATWLNFNPDEVTVSSGSTESVQVIVNKSKSMAPGLYKADAVLASGSTSTNLVPVNLRVNYAPVPTIHSVRVDDSISGDGDGEAEPGEEVDLHITLHNSGSMLLGASTGTLMSTDPTVTIISSSLSWPSIDSVAEKESTVSARVRFAAGAERDVEFTLDVSDGGAHPEWNDLKMSVHVGERRTVSGLVTDAVTGHALKDAAVVFYGANAGRTMTDSNGQYRLTGMLDGSMFIRAQHAGYGDAIWTNVVLNGADGIADFNLGKPDVAGTEITKRNVLHQGTTETLDTTITNSGLTDLKLTIHEMMSAKVAVISDTERLTEVEDVLKSMGLDVDGYSDNINEGYTLNAGNLTPYDICVINLGGEKGFGRKYTWQEIDALKVYLANGGKLILTGRNILGSPDNGALAELIGSDNVGLQNQAISEVEGSGESDPALDGDYCSVSNGALIDVKNLRYDAATADGADAKGLLIAGSGYKVIRNRAFGGELVYWSGNLTGEEWREPGVLQDVFKNIITGWLISDIPWLNITSPKEMTIAAGSEKMITMKTSPVAGMGTGTNTAIALLQANLPDLPDSWIKVKMVVKPVTLDVSATTGVHRWDGTPLDGNGNDDSDIYQLIYAGTNGVADPATANGKTTGDDKVLLTFDSFEAFGRFGDGYEFEPDHGIFERIFGYDLPADSHVFARAWDAKSFALAVAYGDSEIYELTRAVDEKHDFGGWVVGTAPGYPCTSIVNPRVLKDINGDSIPDGWAIANGLDPRDPIEPLAQVVVPEKSSSVSMSGPQKVVVSDNFVFVADTDNNRVLVLNSDLSTIIDSYTGLSNPHGLDYYVAGHKLVVADTDNFRIVLLDVDPASGALSYAGEFGSRGQADGQFDRPVAVAVAQSSGRIFVVDSDAVNTIGCNHRIQRFSITGSHELSFGSIGSGSSQLKWPQGISVAANGFVYVADTGNNRIKCMNSGGSVLWTYGEEGSGDGQFARPYDVREGSVGWLYVADTGNSRLVIIDATDSPSAQRFIGNYGINGGQAGEFRFPRGIFPLKDGFSVYVADTLNNRIQKVHLVADADKDGMDDLWEYKYYDTIDFTDGTDWSEDPDGDGVINLGEYRAGTNPLKYDTNNNGLSDKEEMLCGRDPVGDGFNLLKIRDMGINRHGLDFNVESGRQYRIEFTTNIMGNVWTSDGSTIIAPSNGIYEWSGNTPGGSRVYYRIKRIND